MIKLLLSLLLVLGLGNNVSAHEDIQIYKILAVYNNAHIIEVETLDGAVYTYYQEESTHLTEGMKVIDIDGLLLQCEDNNSYDIEVGEYKVIDVNCNTYLITHDFIITLNEYK